MAVQRRPQESMWEVLCKSLTQGETVHVQSATIQDLPDSKYYGVKRELGILEDKKCWRKSRVPGCFRVERSC